MNEGARPYDYYLILITTIVLFAVSLICLAGMIHFKLAAVHQSAPELRGVYLERMNTAVAPFVAALVLLIGICVPKRILSTRALHRFAGVLGVVALAVGVALGVRMALLVVLLPSLLLQIVVLVLAAFGASRLRFDKKGYWVRVGSSLIHLASILFVLDLAFYRWRTLHLALFWTTTAGCVLGMVMCFWADSLVRLPMRRRPLEAPGARDGDAEIGAGMVG